MRLQIAAQTNVAYTQNLNGSSETSLYRWPILRINNVQFSTRMKIISSISALFITAEMGSVK